jgi:hypothetical protein
MELISWILIFDMWLRGEQEEAGLHSQHTSIDAQIADSKAV